MKQKILALVLCVLVAAGGLFTSGIAQNEQQVMEFTIEEAIDYALEHSNSVKLSEIAVDKAKVSYREADSAYDKVKNLPSADSLETYKLKEGYYKDLAKMGVTLAEKGVVQTRELTRMTIEQMFYETLHAEEEKSIQEEVLKAAERDLEIVQKKFDSGMASELEVMSAEAGVADAQQKYNAAVRDAEYSMMNLNKYLGLPVKTQLKLNNKLELASLPEVDIEEKVAEAIENRLEVISAVEQYDMDKMNFDLISVWYTPNTYKYQAAKYSMENSNYLLVSAQQDVEISVRKAYNDMLNAYEMLDVMKKQVQLAEKSYKVARIKYEVGMSTANEMRKALNAYNEAKLGESQLVLSCNLAKINFEASYGIGIGLMGSSSMSADTGGIPSGGM